MRITDMLNEDEFNTIRTDLHDADWEQPKSVYDMTDEQKRLVQIGQRIKAALSPKTGDVKWDSDEEWLDAMKLSEVLIDAGKNDKDLGPMIKASGIDVERAKSIIEKVKKGNVDITKHTDGDHDGVDKLAKAVADA
ncbi:MAG: hypothetical protein CMA64_06720 [Euryarchaeota archaeon]|nr:hypothetical protein [Euryarchaeota archaeon]|tara:strand:- start:276 stop:683 length:408 start_codon:yes stop_codon:yes gene_type:complete